MRLILLVPLLPLALGACGPPPLRSGDETVTWSGGEKGAIEVARAALAEHTGISPQLIGLAGIEAQQWPDAGMGCADPGRGYAQLITEGHAVTLKAGDRSYEVHVAGQTAIVCE